jgi:hypothetical protein
MTVNGPDHQKRLRILPLCDDRPGNANTIVDHVA